MWKPDLKTFEGMTLAEFFFVPDTIKDLYLTKSLMEQAGAIMTSELYSVAALKGILMHYEDCSAMYKDSYREILKKFERHIDTTVPANCVLNQFPFDPGDFQMQLQEPILAMLDFRRTKIDGVNGPDSQIEINFHFPHLNKQIDPLSIPFASQEFFVLSKIARSLDTIYPFDPGQLNISSNLLGIAGFVGSSVKVGENVILHLLYFHCCENSQQLSFPIHINVAGISLDPIAEGTTSNSSYLVNLAVFKLEFIDKSVLFVELFYMFGGALSLLDMDEVNQDGELIASVEKANNIYSMSGHAVNYCCTLSTLVDLGVAYLIISLKRIRSIVVWRGVAVATILRSTCCIMNNVTGFTLFKQHLISKVGRGWECSFIPVTKKSTSILFLQHLEDDEDRGYELLFLYLNLEDKVLNSGGSNVMNPVMGLEEQQNIEILIGGRGLGINMRFSSSATQPIKSFNWDPG